MKYFVIGKKLYVHFQKIEKMVKNIKKKICTKLPSWPQLAIHIIWMCFSLYWVKPFVSLYVYLAGTMLHIGFCHLYFKIIL